MKASASYSSSSSSSSVEKHQRVLLTLVRHGETFCNKSRTTQGQGGSALTPEGVAQAAALGRRLVEDMFVTRARPCVDVFFTSDLHRCQQTARMIQKSFMKHHQTQERNQASEGIGGSVAAAALQPPAFAFALEALLREKGAGIFEGTPYGSQRKAALAAGQTARAFRSPDRVIRQNDGQKVITEKGEAWTDVMERARIFLDTVMDNLVGLGDTKTTHILAVTHGGFIKEFINEWIMKNKGGHSNKLYPNHAQNTCIFSFSITTDGELHFVEMIEENESSHLGGKFYTGEEESGVENTPLLLNELKWLRSA